ncbi:MAG: hypothetical protein ACKV19_14485 [Verrucomicrobiales bacterium]
MNELQQIIHHALVRQRGIRRQRAWLAAFAAFAAVMVLTALLDRMWMFSGGLRWSGWIAGLVAAAFAARRAIGAACPDATTIAHRIEAEAGETAPVVATAIDPAVRLTAGSEAVGRAMLERLDRVANDAMRVAPPSFRGRLRVPASIAAAALAAIVTMLVIQGPNGLLRLLIPWMALPYTSLQLEGPKEALPEGRPFTLIAQVSGVPVKILTLYRQDSPLALAEAAPDPQGVVRLAMNGLDGPAEFVVRAGDGQSAPLSVTPYPLPAIASFEIAVLPPEYAAHAKDTKSEPSFSALRGSRLGYKVRLKAPAASIVVERSAPPPKEERVSRTEQAGMKRGIYGEPMGVEDPVTDQPVIPVFQPDPVDPLVWHTDWDISAEADDIIYRLAIKGQQGDLVRNEEPWRINVVADSPPVVRIQSHNGGEVIRLGNETVQFKLSAVDDVRLSGARLVFRKPGQPHTRQEIKLPAEAGRSWSGAELLALAPMNVKPLDIIAVHAEAEDSNALEGTGVGRSEVVYLEVPLPESEDDGGGGGGGGGNGPPPINLLELQMEILKATVVTPDNAPASDPEAIAYDQRRNAEYTGMMAQAAAAMLLPDLADVLEKARHSMEAAASLLDKQAAVKAVPDEEAALASLIEAVKMVGEAKESLQSACEAEGKMSLTLSKPKPKSSSAKGDKQEESAAQKEALRKLMEEVQRQLAGQQKLNQDKGDAAQRSKQQQALAQDARSAASQAEDIKPSADGRGDPKAAAKELERAAGLEEDNAEALASGDGEASKELGEQSEQALAKALREIAAQLGSGISESETYPPGYERLVDDYLRSISYE